MANLSIYESILRPVESSPSFADTMQKGMSLKQLAMQNKNMETQMADQELKKRMSSVSEAMESMAGMTPEQRKAKFPGVQQQLIQAGAIKPEHAMPELDEGLFQRNWGMIQKTPEYQDRQQNLAKTRLTNAQADAAVPDALSKRALERSQADYYSAQAAEKRADAGKPKATPDQLKVAGFVKRAEQAEDAARQLIDGGYNPTTAGADVQSRWFYPGIKQSGEYKGYDQASRNFISAVLRRESGAAISNSEYENERQKYFPVPGDDKDTIAQKAAARAQAMAGLKAESGSAYDLVPTIAAHKRTPQKQDGGIIETAQADEGAPKVPSSAVPPTPDSIKMTDREGNQIWVPKNMVGAVIANGGSKVKN